MIFDACTFALVEGDLKKYTTKPSIKELSRCSGVVINCDKCGTLFFLLIHDNQKDGYSVISDACIFALVEGGFNPYKAIIKELFHSSSVVINCDKCGE